MAHDIDDVSHRLEPSFELLRTLWALNHAIERTSSRMEAELGMTAQQRIVIRLIGKLPGVTPGQLAQLLHVDRGTITAMLKRLEARKLLVRKVSPHDRRSVSLWLSAKGKKIDVPTKISVEHAVVLTLQQSSRADVAAVRRLLGRLVTALSEVSAVAEHA